MTSIWTTTIWLYLGDVSFVGLLIWGVCTTAMWAAGKTARALRLNITYNQLRRFMTFQVIWLLAGLVLFKTIILEGGPGFTHLVGTGNQGSVQFSTVGEGFAAALTLTGLYRWTIFLKRHISTKARELDYDRN